MEKADTKKAKWLSTVTFTNGVAIKQHIFSKDIANFIKTSKITLHLELDKIHSYVFPYLLNEAKKQIYEVKKIEVTILDNENK